MYQDPLMEVRAALLTSTNTGGTLQSGVAVEVQHLIDQLIADVINRGVDLRPLVSRKPMSQLSWHWNVRTDLGTSSKLAFYAAGSSEAASGTPFGSTKRQLLATAVGLRADYAVSGLFLS